MASPLKKEWDEKNGKLTRKCGVCGKEFKPAKWNQSLCTDEFCKEGSFRYSHFQASLRRWQQWKDEAKKKNISYGKEVKLT